MRRINFSHNWNSKLSQNIFTTIRKDDELGHKYDYYKKLVGDTFDVSLNGTIIGHAVLIDAELSMFNELPYGLVLTDTGTSSYKEAAGIFRQFGIEMDSDVIILTFEKVD